VSSVHFDTSAFMKLLVTEMGSQTAHEAWLSARQVSASRLMYVETRAAVAAMRRAGRLSAAQAAQVKYQLSFYWQQVSVVEATPTVIEDAGDLAEDEALRGYDAVHLASALSAGIRIMACADVDLLAAARARGMKVIDTRS
jgi:uncharacterized protein